MSRSINAPQGALAHALSVRRIAIWGPDHPRERLAIADELIRLADEMGELELALEGRQWRLSTVFELGDMPAVGREIEAYGQLADSLREPHRLSGNRGGSPIFAVLSRSSVATPSSTRSSRRGVLCWRCSPATLGTTRARGASSTNLPSTTSRISPETGSGCPS